MFSMVVQVILSESPESSGGLLFSEMNPILLLSLHNDKMINKTAKIFAFILSLPVYFYRYSISPFLRPSCRHVPTCSQYALDALKIHGPITGSLLAINRILRCRPGGTHGFDPVPLIKFRRYRPLSMFLKRTPSESRLKR
jgi:putative membrane protein insertion efficiency factor